MALWRNNTEGNMEKENVNPADPLCWEKNQKHHNQTVCALAVALLCALVLALLVLDFRFERPFAAGVDTNTEPLSAPPWYSHFDSRGRTLGPETPESLKQVVNPLIPLSLGSRHAPRRMSRCAPQAG